MVVEWKRSYNTLLEEGKKKKKRDVYKGGGVRWMSIKIASNARWLGELRRRE